jgi:hypothetical protein
VNIDVEETERSQNHQKSPKYLPIVMIKMLNALILLSLFDLSILAMP